MNEVELTGQANRARFHHAVPVDDLARACAFYRDMLGCRLGHVDNEVANVYFFGHHVILHATDGEEAAVHRSASHGPRVAYRHFGVALQWEEWQALSTRLQAQGADFLIEPAVKYLGKPHEEAVMFLRDPAGNGVEFKAFRDEAHLWGPSWRGDRTAEASSLMEPTR